MRYRSIIGLMLAIAIMFFNFTITYAEEKKILTKKVEGFEVLADISGSMGKKFTEGTCKDLDKVKVQFDIIRRFSAEIPQLNYVSSMRVLGIKNLIASPADYSKVMSAPAKFDRPSYVAIANSLEATAGITGMEPAVRMSNQELGSMGGRKALIIISDFEKSADFGDPVAAAGAMKKMYGPELKIYTIGITGDEKTRALAESLAAAGGGKFFDACVLVGNEAALKAAVKEIFYDEYVETDSDGDGVPDSMDKCPGTPRGAIVDARGCWVAAYDYFFDFDKAVIKPQYMDHIGRAADIIKQDPSLALVTVDGHTDSVGTQAYNLDLGKRRAEAVKAALVGFGVDAAKLETASYGETRPAAENDTDYGRQLNRRVELGTVLK